MTFKLQNLKRRAPAIAVAGLILAASASAATAGPIGGGSGSTEIFGRTCGFLAQIQGWIFGIAYLLGAIGLVVIAVSAFLGRFKFAHLIALGGGLFIVAMADLLIRFATDGQGDTNTCNVP
jgi:hypothetical protein